MVEQEYIKENTFLNGLHQMGIKKTHLPYDFLVDTKKRRYLSG
jgi:hypothetical protein